MGPIMSSSNYSSPPLTQSNTSPGFFTTMKEGIALGAGSAIGSRIVSGIFGPPTVEVKTSQPSPPAATTPVVYGSTAGKPCEEIRQTYHKCLDVEGKRENCESQLSLLNKCLSGSS
jgi:hypothetical protein